MAREGGKGKRKWLPLESDPTVFSAYAKALGCKGLAFSDVFGLDVELLAMVPRPVVAVILLFPIEKKDEAEAELQGESHESGSDATGGDVFYVKQKIGNACGTIALLHALANNQDLVEFEEGSFISTFVRECQGLSPDEKADYLDKMAEDGLESAHNAAAVSDASEGKGEAGKQLSEEEINTDLHFVCYVERNGALWELDGRNPLGTVKLGQCTKEDLLERTAEAIGKRMEKSSSLRFNILAATS
ncbi:ubiquitin carboxyl-terminal hydrolase [Chloropicon primus]|uniref:Ubiquitin carboxyl-terminal hydrolase n=1 Tax=Chloropicon primus TaxID=1764295 RepID=A0A5B8MPN9_9CHLO|nr:ubiquitin carboxyl-terminal hydrolase [Chloropicon primus]UPR01234.1 ubiquitin carboxyl-terminal hydrolase [Chloropicon primus]|mmetsp:Transcript_15665/g.32426  ORF Transcript_15665/g.32426 Transcript_15665/m.32426 type:complete len:245 (-) Transcript_15665:171-905(-)|eukprot:QDZ22014.1 ubiquitin carboxyl-terminal hydrolase [Chloropicon primus]